jgi:hypothetical protein
MQIRSPPPLPKVLLSLFCLPRTPDWGLGGPSFGPELAPNSARICRGIPCLFSKRGCVCPDKSRPIPTPMPAGPAPRLTIIFSMVEGMAPRAMRKNSNFGSSQIGPNSWIPAIRRNNFRRPPVAQLSNRSSHAY